MIDGTARRGPFCALFFSFYSSYSITHIKKIISSLLITENVGKPAHRHRSAVTQLLLSRDGIFRTSFNEMHVVDDAMKSGAEGAS